MSLWQTEMVEIMRGLLFDFNDTPTYADATLTRLLIVAAHYVSREAEFSNSFAVDISEAEIDPDPSATATKDADFINLTCLKAACMVDRGATRIAVAEGILIKDDKATLDFRDKALNSLAILKQGYCAAYDKSLTQYNHDRSSSLAAAILSPFRTEYRGQWTEVMDFSK